MDFLVGQRLAQDKKSSKLFYGGHGVCLVSRLGKIFQQRALAHAEVEGPCCV